jgi:transcriptional regulator with XRE-family HTH domain
MSEWNSKQIRQLREQRDQNQTEFGKEIFSTTPRTAQKLISKLETGKMSPGTATIRTLDRMEQGEI